MGGISAPHGSRSTFDWIARARPLPLSSASYKLQCSRHFSGRQSLFYHFFEMSETITVKERAWRLFVVLLLAFGTSRLLVDDLVRGFQPRDEINRGDMSLHELASRYRELGCPVHRFKSISLLSRSPMMILIEGFVTPAEAAALVQIAYQASLFCIYVRDPRFSDSTVGAGRSLSKGRRSQSAFLKAPAKFNRSDEDMIVHCMEARASEFQGYIPIDDMETLQVVKCEPGHFPSDMTFVEEVH